MRSDVSLLIESPNKIKVQKTLIRTKPHILIFSLIPSSLLLYLSKEDENNLKIKKMKIDVNKKKQKSRHGRR